MLPPKELLAVPRGRTGREERSKATKERREVCKTRKTMKSKLVEMLVKELMPNFGEIILAKEETSAKE